MLKKVEIERCKDFFTSTLAEKKLESTLFSDEIQWSDGKFFIAKVS